MDDLGVGAWPTGVPIQLHVAADDPWFDREDALGAAGSVPDDLLDYHEYPIDAYLFADSDWGEHHLGATTPDARRDHDLARDALPETDR